MYPGRQPRPSSQLFVLCSYRISFHSAFSFLSHFQSFPTRKRKWRRRSSPVLFLLSFSHHITKLPLEFRLVIFLGQCPRTPNPTQTPYYNTQGEAAGFRQILNIGAISSSQILGKRRYTRNLMVITKSRGFNGQQCFSLRCSDTYPKTLAKLPSLTTTTTTLGSGSCHHFPLTASTPTTKIMITTMRIWRGFASSARFSIQVSAGTLAPVARQKMHFRLLSKCAPY